MHLGRAEFKHQSFGAVSGKWRAITKGRVDMREILFGRFWLILKSVLGMQATDFHASVAPAMAK
jgi:hypothetical protein